MIKVLFVCMGNICRSPTAWGIFKQKVSQAGLSDKIEVDSAGTEDYHVGQGADPRAVRCAAEAGYDISMHRARQVTRSDFETFDYILAMDRTNLAALRAMAPEAYRNKPQLFMRYASDCDIDVIADPYYGKEDGFRRVIALCENASEGLLRHIEKTYALKPHAKP